MALSGLNLGCGESGVTFTETGQVARSWLQGPDDEFYLHEVSLRSIMASYRL